jgi:hypothetical protein
MRRFFLAGRRSEVLGKVRGEAGRRTRGAVGKSKTQRCQGRPIPMSDGAFKVMSG